jgi:hypothetical protein
MREIGITLERPVNGDWSTEKQRFQCVGESWETFNLDTVASSAFRSFAETDFNGAHAVVAFVKQYGPLEHSARSNDIDHRFDKVPPPFPSRKDKHHYAGEVWYYQEEATKLRKLIEIWEALRASKWSVLKRRSAYNEGVWQFDGIKVTGEYSQRKLRKAALVHLTHQVNEPIRPAEPELTITQSDSMLVDLSFNAGDLRSAFYLQFAEAIHQGTRMAYCRNCKEPFNQTRTNRKYCSERCKTYFNRRNGRG